MTEENTPTPETQETTETLETPQASTSEDSAPKVEKETTAKAETETKPSTAPKTTPKDGHWWWGTGRRKAAVARVRIRPGSGEFNVNNKKLTDYFSELRDHQDIVKVLEKTNTNGSLDVFVNTNGGGYTGQSGAIILGLGRALAKYDPSLDSVLRSNGYLSRDPRRVERKKPGQPGARKRFQFSKR
jgi:small subunit ribosomal protein S9